MVGAGFAGEAGVDDDAYAGDGEAGFGDGGGEHDAAPGAVAAAEHGVLDGGGCLAVELEDVGAGVAEHPGDAGDLAGAGEEAQDVAVAGAQRGADGGGDVVEEGGVDAHAVRRPDAVRRGCVGDGDGVEAAFGVDDGCVAEQPGPGVGVGGGGGGDDAQVGAEGGAHVEEEGHGGVGVEVAFVALVEEDGGGAGEFLVALEPLEEDAGGDDLDDGAGETLRSPRTVCPTRPPVSSPRSQAMRRAAALAAMRRGSATTTVRAGRPSSRSPARASGTRVVLPVPGGAARTAQPWLSRASWRAGRAVRTGRAARASSRRPAGRGVTGRRRRRSRCRG